MSNKNKESTSERKSTVATTTHKGSRSSLGRERSMIEQMDHDVSVLASRLEEEFACVSSTSSSDVWYIDSGAFAHMMGVRECFLTTERSR